MRHVPAEGSAIESALDALGARAAGVIVEPLVQGAAGMRMHSPEFLRSVRAACDQRGLPMIADEVMTGFGRTGTLFACGQAGITPDLMCLAKGLTGGIFPLSATLCTQALFDRFLSDDRGRALFHGHSFTANPIGCAVARASLALTLENDVPSRLDAIGSRIHARLDERLGVRSGALQLRRTGGIVALDLPDSGGYLAARALELRQRALELGVLLRPLGNVLYAMPPAATTDAQCDTIADALFELSG